MNKQYEFHEGDYVETVDGDVGYIINVVNNKDFDYYIPLTKETLFGRTGFLDGFKRIGKYTFETSQNQDVKKIKKLETHKFKEKKCTKVFIPTMGDITTTYNTVEKVLVKNNITQDDIANKINEIIDRLNEME